MAELELQLALFKKQIFGTGKNEKQDKTQLLLKLGQLETKLLEAKTATITYERREPSAPQPPAEAVFAHLPVKERIEIIPTQVQADPTLYERIGEETTFEVDMVPPQLFKRLIVRPKYRHALDRSRPPLVAPAPKRPVEGGYASAGLIAYVVLSKYAHHLPLFRQEQMSARWGAKLSRKTMSDWVLSPANGCSPFIGECERG